jgi:hypothetical protein
MAFLNTFFVDKDVA